MLQFGVPYAGRLANSDLAVIGWRVENAKYLLRLRLTILPPLQVINTTSANNSLSFRLFSDLSIRSWQPLTEWHENSSAPLPAHDTLQTCTISPEDTCARPLREAHDSSGAHKAGSKAANRGRLHMQGEKFRRSSSGNPPRERQTDGRAENVALTRELRAEAEFMLLAARNLSSAP